MRSSCEAVATNARRAASWRRSRDCMRANARVSSPISSGPRSSGSGLGLRPAALELAGGVAQPLQAAQQRGREPDPEQQRDQQAGAGGLEERPLHDAHRRGDVVQALDQHHDVAAGRRS